MCKIFIIKTLPHLHSLFFPTTDDFAYLSELSKEGISWLNSLKLFDKSFINYHEFLKSIVDLNFIKIDKVSTPGEYQIKGDVVSIWTYGYDHPIRISFFGSEVESMYLYDEVFGRKIEDISYFYISQINKSFDFTSCHIRHNCSSIKQNKLQKIAFTKTFNGIFSLLDIPFESVSDEFRDSFNKNNVVSNLEQYDFLQTDFNFPQLFFGQYDLFAKELHRLDFLGYKIFLSQDLINNEDIKKLVNKIPINKKLQLDLNFSLQIPQNLNAGFTSSDLKIAYFTDRELHGTIYLSRSERFTKTSSNIEKLLRQFEGNIKMGDYVVHEDYGIAIYKGLQQEQIDGNNYEFLELEFDRSDLLFVPINQIQKITKYIGPDGMVKLSKLGGRVWQNLKKKVINSTGVVAKQLLEHYARLSITKTDPLDINDSEDYENFVKEFPFKPTEDQLIATSEIIQDLSKDTPMNRLLVGDVGFGKTEVIMRACFKVTEQGGQVLVISPTTILTQQHYEVFSKRFKNFPISVDFVSRFKSHPVNKMIIDKFNAGKIDILIGTHILLSNNIKPPRLKFVVVDEEQRFGVKQKEKLRQLNYSAHMLLVSATPIPRTLGMALSSIQNLSIISTPPMDRKSVKTQIIKNDWQKIIDSIKFEVERGGQVFFLHNQVNTIDAIRLKLQNLLPNYKFTIAHGQMNTDDLDKAIAEFYNKKFDVLISTTIIENGVDMPNVNTIIINNAENFGLSQLYQLRGRVGRSDKQAYCYLVYRGENVEKQKDVNNQKSSKKLALQRLQAIVENQELGASFKIASRDLEIRGAGNLLGDQQSGFMASVGYALYLQLLAQKVEEIKNQKLQARI